jgi:hypothetical protein
MVLTRVSSKKNFLGLNQNKPKQDLFRLCFVKPKAKKFGLFRCFEPISKQPKQTELFRNKPKQTKTTLNFLKNFQICSLSNCFFGLLLVSVQSVHQNSLFRCRSETTETNCIETNRKKMKNGKPYIFRKNTKICSLFNCFGWSSVCFGSIET